MHSEMKTPATPSEWYCVAHRIKGVLITVAKQYKTLSAGDSQTELAAQLNQLKAAIEAIERISSQDCKVYATIEPEEKEREDKVRQYQELLQTIFDRAQTCKLSMPGEDALDIIQNAILEAQSEFDQSKQKDQVTVEELLQKKREMHQAQYSEIGATIDYDIDPQLDDAVFTSEAVRALNRMFTVYINNVRDILAAKKEKDDKDKKGEPGVNADSERKMVQEKKDDFYYTIYIDDIKVPREVLKHFVETLQGKKKARSPAKRPRKASEESVSSTDNPSQFKHMKFVTFTYPIELKRFIKANRGHIEAIIFDNGLKYKHGRGLIGVDLLKEVMGSLPPYVVMGIRSAFSTEEEIAAVKKQLAHLDSRVHHVIDKDQDDKFTDFLSKVQTNWAERPAQTTWTPQIPDLIIRVFPEGELVIIEIEDTAGGMPEKVRKALELGEQISVKADGQDGNGIGARDARAQMVDLGGQLQLTSPTPGPKPGSKFRWAIPKSKALKSAPQLSETVPTLQTHPIPPRSPSPSAASLPKTTSSASTDDGKTGELVQPQKLTITVKEPEPIRGDVQVSASRLVAESVRMSEPTASTAESERGSLVNSVETELKADVIETSTTSVISALKSAVLQSTEEYGPKMPTRTTSASIVPLSSKTDVKADVSETSNPQHLASRRLPEVRAPRVPTPIEDKDAHVLQQTAREELRRALDAEQKAREIQEMRASSARSRPAIRSALDARQTSEESSQLQVAGVTKRLSDPSTKLQRPTSVSSAQSTGLFASSSSSSASERSRGTQDPRETERKALKVRTLQLPPIGEKAPRSAGVAPTGKVFKGPTFGNKG